MHFKINDKTDDLSFQQSGGFNSNMERANVNKSHRRNATRDNDVETLKVYRLFEWSQMGFYNQRNFG